MRRNMGLASFNWTSTTHAGLLIERRGRPEEDVQRRLAASEIGQPRRQFRRVLRQGERHGHRSDIGISLGSAGNASLGRFVGLDQFRPVAPSPVWSKSGLNPSRAGAVVGGWFHSPRLPGRLRGCDFSPSRSWTAPLHGSDTGFFAPKGPQHISPGQSGAAIAAERRPGLGWRQRPKP